MVGKIETLPAAAVDILEDQIKKAVRAAWETMPEVVKTSYNIAGGHEVPISLASGQVLPLVQSIDSLPRVARDRLKAEVAAELLQANNGQSGVLFDAVIESMRMDIQTDFQASLQGHGE